MLVSCSMLNRYNIETTCICQGVKANKRTWSSQNLNSNRSDFWLDLVDRIQIPVTQRRYHHSLRAITPTLYWLLSAGCKRNDPRIREAADHISYPVWPDNHQASSDAHAFTPF